MAYIENPDFSHDDDEILRSDEQDHDEDEDVARMKKERDEFDDFCPPYPH